jgi:hypothetical protein
MSKDANDFSIVLLGTMNPRIHHPVWYKLVGIFTEEEIAEALQAASVICIPPLAQFNVKDIVIKCQSDRWEIHTTERDELNQIREVTAKVFDELLKHTRLSKVGLNFDYKREAQASNVSRFLAGRLAEATRGMGLPSPITGDLVFRRLIGAGSADVHAASNAVRPTEDGSVLAFFNNYEYDFNELKIEGFFDLGLLLPRWMETDLADSEDFLSRFLDAINATVRGRHGSGT